MSTMTAAPAPVQPDQPVPGPLDERDPQVSSGEARQDPDREVYGGVDTHKDSHTAAAVDRLGRVLGTAQFAADAAGYVALLAWLSSFGTLIRTGIEGTGSYGHGLARYLAGAGEPVVEIDRPDRKLRRSAGKSDPIDAIAAARAAAGGTQSGIPKDRTGQVEALRVLRIPRRSAIAARAVAQTEIKALLVTAPEALRQRLRHLGDADLITTCANLRPDPEHLGDPAQATKAALRHLARRHQDLTAHIADLDAVLAPLVTAINADLLALSGVGVEVAGQLLVTAGANPERLHSEAAFAMLCGVAPIPASSGQRHRHRLNRGGDRHANAALYRIVLCRLRWDERTRAYAARRTAEGRTKAEIIRCLKRYIAREVYHVLTRTPTQANAA